MLDIFFISIDKFLVFEVFGMYKILIIKDATQGILGGCLVFDGKTRYWEKENTILFQYLVNTNT
jgi:hypothetical protein